MMAERIPDESGDAGDIASSRVVPIRETRLPLPPVPEDADVTWADDMPLDVRRLRDSGIAQGSSEAFHAAVLLWASAWHQVPAGSLPDNDNELAALAGLGRGGLPIWMRLRADALRGFVKCRDGRLYHPVICEKVLAVLSRRKRQSEDGKRAAMARWKQAGNQQDTCEGIAPAVPSQSDGNATAMRIDAIERNGEERNGLTLTPPDGGVAAGADAPSPRPAGSNAPRVYPDCPYERIVTAYHEAMPANPQFREWNDRRRSAMRARFREKFDAGKYQNADGGVEWFRKFFRHAAKSRFLTGQCPPTGGRDRPFVADLMWLLKAENFACVIEGKYNDA